MNINKSIILFLFGVAFCIDYNNNIYTLSSSSRNLALGNIRIDDDNISSIFDAPLTVTDNSKNIYFSYNKEFDGLSELIHFGYCFKSSSNYNLGLGIAQRNIKNNYNTDNAWIDNGDNIPDFDEIDYSKIIDFIDQEIGLLISYNNFIGNNSLIGFNIKPNYHSIGSSNALGLSFDITYLKKISFNKIIIGLNDFMSVKKWNYGLKEKFAHRFFINYSCLVNNLLFSIEYDNYSNLKFGFEYQINKQFALQIGSNDSNLSFGIGCKTNYLDINYAYIHNNNIDLNQSHKLGFLFKIKKI